MATAEAINPNYQLVTNDTGRVFRVGEEPRQILGYSRTVVIMAAWFCNTSVVVDAPNAYFFCSASSDCLPKSTAACAEATLARYFQRMQTHRASYTAPHRLLRCHIAAIGHMRAAATLVGAKKIRAENRSIFLGHEYLMSRREPVSQRILTRNVRSDRISFSGRDHFVKNFPDRIVV